MVYELPFSRPRTLYTIPLPLGSMRHCSSFPYAVASNWRSLLVCHILEYWSHLALGFPGSDWRLPCIISIIVELIWICPVPCPLMLKEMGQKCNFDHVLPGSLSCGVYGHGPVLFPRARTWSFWHGQDQGLLLRKLAILAMLSTVSKKPLKCFDSKSATFLLFKATTATGLLHILMESGVSICRQYAYWLDGFTTCGPSTILEVRRH